MQDNKKDYWTITIKKDYWAIAIKVLKIASAVLALVAIYFALNALLSIDWEVVNAYGDYLANPSKYSPYGPKVGDTYVTESAFFKALRADVLVNGAKKACFCLIPAPVLYVIAILIEKK